METDERPSLHVAFCPSWGNNIRKAFQRKGRPERVIDLMDDLSVGPIDPSDPLSRASWIAGKLGYDWHEVCKASEVFWGEATSTAGAPIAWVSRNYAYGYSGFLEFVWRMAERPFRVIDASDLRLREGGFLGPSQIIESGLFARQTTVSNAEREQHLDLWRRLRAENAPFRIVGAPGLVSAPITYDDTILACIAPEWRGGARIVGDTMRELFERPVAQSVGDKVIWSRVLALAHAGVVELEGPGPEMRDVQVRRIL